MEDLLDVMQENLAYYFRQERSIASRMALLPRGAVKKRKKNNADYFYLQYRKGKKVAEEYVGKVFSEELRNKLRLRETLKGELKRVKEAIYMLNHTKKKETDLLEPIKLILQKFTQLNLWETGIEIIGSWSFIIYQAYLPVEKYPLKTLDLDILVPLPYEGKAFDFSVFFRELGFQEQFNPDGSMFFTGGLLKIEFLAPRKERYEEKEGRFIKPLAITPQTLNYLNMLLEEPLELKIAPGIKVIVPSPSGFMLHKLLISTLARRKAKRAKDLKQAIYLGKYVFFEPLEREKLEVQWARFSPAWKRKVRQALTAALELLPLEQGIVRHLLEELH